MYRIISTVLIVSLIAPSLALARQQPIGGDHFLNVKLMVSTGDKAEATDAVLILTPDAMIVQAKKGRATLKTLPYASLKSAEYSYSKSPRWKSAIGLSILCIVCGVATAFMKGKKHWLAVTGDGEYAVLQLDKGNYKIILPAFEAKAGRKIETLADDK
jgi:hypothetical protein